MKNAAAILEVSLECIALPSRPDLDLIKQVKQEPMLQTGSWCPIPFGSDPVKALCTIRRIRRRIA